MTSPRFLQIHALQSYTASLLNRDDSGLAKRLPFGDHIRTRISSQCLKRHWRFAEDPHALSEIAGSVDSHRSRELVTLKVIKPLVDGKTPEEVVKAIETVFQKQVYGDKGDSKKGRQTLLMGDPELNWLREEAARLSTEAAGDGKEAKKLAEAWAKDYKKNIHALRETVALPGGLTAALFGRMVTSDVLANIDAPVHVAHAFTVHAEESESDYFTAVDDLKLDDADSGADMIQETELTSGLYYVYLVVDIPGLLKNLGGDADLAGRVLHNLLYLVAEVSPGAKLGATAPYGRAQALLVETGDRQPRSLADAFRTPVSPDSVAAFEALEAHLANLDRIYQTDETRLGFRLDGQPLAGLDPVSLAEIAQQIQATISQAGGEGQAA